MEGFLQFLAIFAAVISAVVGDLSLSADKTTVKLGDIVNITCRITEMEQGSFVSWIKVSEEEITQFADNAALKTDYKEDDSRYSLQIITLDDGQYDIVLTINGVLLEDAGVYQVKWGFDEGEPADQLELTVQADPSTPKLTFDGAEILGGEEFEMEEGSLHDVRCEVSGAAPSASLQVLAGTTLVSDVYSETVTPNSKEGVFVGFYEVSYETVLEGNQVAFDARYANKEVKCVVPGTNFSSPSFKTKFPSMSPVWSAKCPESVLSYNGAVDIELGCMFTALPLGDVHVKWHHRNPAAGDEFNVSPSTDAADMPKHYNIFVDKIDETTANARLTINHVFPQMFRDYTFVAENERGSTNYTVKLVRVSSGQLSVKVELDKEVANIGDDLRVKCDVTNEKAERFIITWVKKTGDNDEVEMGTNSFINEEFKKTGRFEATVHYEKDQDLRRVFFELKILDLKASDSGEIGCRIPSERIEVFRDFTVMVPISLIKLNSVDVNGSHGVTYVNNQEVTFDEGEVRRMYCHINGSYPAPEVKMMIGDKDVTDMFERTVTLRKSGAIPGLQDLGYEVKMANEAMTIEYDYSGKLLQCIASVPKTPFSEESVGITIKLAGYKPKFLCQQTQISKPHQRNVNISCLVRADPPIKDFRFYWDKMSDGNETLEQGEQRGHYKADIVPGETEFESVMVLYIDRVFIQHFREYYFEAENDLGVVKHEIKLNQDPSYDMAIDVSIETEREELEDPEMGEVSAASQLILSTFLILSAFILSL